MNHLKIMLCLASVLAIGQVNAQTKKTSTTKSKKVPHRNVTKQSKTSSTTAAASNTFSSANGPVQSATSAPQKDVNEEKKSDEPKLTGTTNRLAKTSSAAPYKAAVGIKFLWGISATGKYFLKEDQAVEAIIRYRSYSGLGKDIAITALYQFEKPISGAAGLHWVAGAGLYFGHFSYKSSVYEDLYPSSGNSFYGASAMAGLEYKIKKAPLAISADWMPAFDFNGGGFGAESGGIGVKYTF
ncbi:MAG: hypothetical protein ACN6O7_02675 [Sphingobacterium sp.]